MDFAPNSVVTSFCEKYTIPEQEFYDVCTTLFNSCLTSTFHLPQKNTILQQPVSSVLVTDEQENKTNMIVCNGKTKKNGTNCKVSKNLTQPEGSSHYYCKKHVLSWESYDTVSCSFLIENESFLETKESCDSFLSSIEKQTSIKKKTPASTYLLKKQKNLIAKLRNGGKKKNILNISDDEEEEIVIDKKQVKKQTIPKKTNTKQKTTINKKIKKTTSQTLTTLPNDKCDENYDKHDEKPTCYSSSSEEEEDEDDYNTKPACSDDEEFEEDENNNEEDFEITIDDQYDDM